MTSPFVKAVDGVWGTAGTLAMATMGVFGVSVEVEVRAPSLPRRTSGGGGAAPRETIEDQKVRRVEPEHEYDIIFRIVFKGRTYSRTYHIDPGPVAEVIAKLIKSKTKGKDASTTVTARMI